MKKLLQFVAVAVIAALVPLTVSVSTFAQEAPSCEISNTGPGSNNECEVEEEYRCEIDNENNVTIKNSNDQTVGSGSASVNGDGTGGGAISGSTSNNSNATFTVVIDNNNEENPCVVQSVVPTPETPEVPETPATPSTPAQPAAAPAPTKLPATNGSEMPIVVLSLGGIVALAGAFAAYRRLFL